MIRPLGNRVLLQPLEEEEKSAGGIVLPDTARKKPQQGKVVAVGPGKTLEDGRLVPVSVKVGDVVVYPEFGGTELKIKDKEYVIIDEDSLLGIRR
jgi:chaperonin GroES